MGQAGWIRKVALRGLRTGAVVLIAVIAGGGQGTVQALSCGTDVGYLTRNVTDHTGIYFSPTICGIDVMHGYYGTGYSEIKQGGGGCGTGQVSGYFCSGSCANTGTVSTVSAGTWATVTNPGTIQISTFAVDEAGGAEYACWKRS